MHPSVGSEGREGRAGKKEGNILSSLSPTPHTPHTHTHFTQLPLPPAGVHCTALPCVCSMPACATHNTPKNKKTKTTTFVVAFWLCSLLLATHPGGEAGRQAVASVRWVEWDRMSGDLEWRWVVSGGSGDR